MHQTLKYRAIKAKINFSIIIPVYNRPNEIKELLHSLVFQDYKKSYEIVIIEDGSTVKCKDVVALYSSKLNISYLYKNNSLKLSVAGERAKRHCRISPAGNTP